ncbi:GNAT family N-acetyltransferase [Micromonospora echinofusca]|uniref:lipid II:glycine glycyltransferase FemX n=1 Tax=Micromonospora echinofusca TaxID=47858 RepID=UPI0033C3418D
MSRDLTIISAGSAARQLDPDCPDVYFTAGYGQATATVESGTWQLAHRDGRIMLPYVVRDVNGVDADATSPYGYAGVHVAPDCAPGELADFWARAIDHWRDTGMVSLFLRFSPLDVASVEAVRQLGVDLTRRPDTITVDVTSGPDQVWDRMEGRSRTAIRKARNCGLTAGVRPTVGTDLLADSPFRQLYEQTMVRLGSRPWYLFPDRYYHQLASGLDKALSVAEVRDACGAVVASALVMRHRDRAHYHLAGSDPVAARNGANNLILWTILEWAAENGCRWVHLGGGLTADDGLFRFKRSFGGARTPFWTGSVVVDPRRYEVLLADRAARLGRSVEDVRAAGFFPAYRTGNS